MNSKVLKLVALCVFFGFGNLQAQDEKSASDSTEILFESSERPTIELNPSAAEKKKRKNKDKGSSSKKEPKRKKNEFWGVFAKKIILKHTSGKNVTYEKFYILPSYEAPSKYVWDKYYFDAKDAKKRKIVKTRYESPKYGMPLHGSYEKFVNGKLREKGYYYKGTKHGRWIEYDWQDVLIKKEKWNKGYPKDSQVYYYDAKRTLVKEVVPYIYGQKEGLYLSFYKNGRIKEMGEYQHGEKVGRWTEYKNTGSVANRKRIIDYPRYYWEEEEPVIVNEW